MPSKSDINPSTGKPYAVNPASGVWDDNYWANVVEPQLKAKFPSRSSTPASAPAIDPFAQAQRILEFQRQANQPRISSLQAQIPEIRSRYEGEQQRVLTEKEPLKQRYQSIIDELKRRETIDVSAAQRRTAQEFGARGIPLSSTLHQDELIRAESPIRQAYGGQIKDVGFEQEASLRNLDTLASNLKTQGVDAELQIQDAISLLQAGNPESAIAGAMQLLGLQQQAAQFEANLGLQKEQLTLSERELGIKETLAKQPDTEIVNIGGRAKLVNSKTGAVIQDLGIHGSPDKPTESQTQSTLKNQFLKEATKGATLSQLSRKFGGQLGINDIVKLYTAVSPHGVPKESWAKEILGINTNTKTNGDPIVDAWLKSQGINP